MSLLIINPPKLSTGMDGAKSSSSSPSSKPRPSPLKLGLLSIPTRRRNPLSPSSATRSPLSTVHERTPTTSFLAPNTWRIASNEKAKCQPSSSFEPAFPPGCNEWLHEPKEPIVVPAQTISKNKQTIDAHKKNPFRSLTYVTTSSNSSASLNFVFMLHPWLLFKICIPLDSTHLLDIQNSHQKDSPNTSVIDFTLAKPARLFTLVPSDCTGVPEEMQSILRCGKKGTWIECFDRSSSDATCKDTYTVSGEAGPLLGSLRPYLPQRLRDRMDQLECDDAADEEELGTVQLAERVKVLSLRAKRISATRLNIK